MASPGPEHRRDRYCYNSFRAVTETRNFALYLRDQWSVTDIGLVINAGLRWEAQEIFGADGSKQIALYDNIAPRVGATWDPTRKGRSKIYAQFGRFYQSIPMGINDRAFSGEGLLVGYRRWWWPSRSRARRVRCRTLGSQVGACLLRWHRCSKASSSMRW